MQRIWSILLFLTLALGCLSLSACGQGDDDDNDASSDDDADDDDTLDDDTLDDDTDDDDTLDDDTLDDDTGDDDTLDDDTLDDDTGDDDTFDPGPATYGWILMDNNRVHVSDVLARAGDLGIDNVHLSHDLIMEIDEINNDDERAELLQSIAQEAHGLGLTVWVWSHEFTDVPFMFCFDPADPIWEERRDAYREALTRIPEIDGVVLMFGSADFEPWYIPCFCQWCADQEPTGNPLLDAINSRPIDRAMMVYEAVAQVVLDEFDKQLRMRTFMHQPLEIHWLGESLRRFPRHELQVMTKDVPQDWQPYYPHDPLIGNVGHRHQIIEMDLGNEYWGRSLILNGQVDYIYYRYAYDRANGARGAAARVERGGDHAFGNANEINIYAFTRLVQDETATPDDVYREWFDQRYGIASPGAAADTLKEIFRNSHFAMRKMYYQLGQWTLEKSSEVPGGARYPEQLWTRASVFYDSDWLQPFLSLVLPSEQTLIDLWQENAEARELAANNLTDLESIEGAFTVPADYAELHDKLELHEDCTELWQLIDDVVYRFVFMIMGHEEHKVYLEWDALTLLDLADAMEARWGASVSPGNPERVREFVEDLRQSFAVQPTSEQWTQPTLFAIAAEPIAADQVRITWSSDVPMTSQVEWGDELPLYDDASEDDPTLTTEHEVIITVDDAAARTVYHVVGTDETGTLVRSSDFWFGLDPQE